MKLLSNIIYKAKSLKKEIAAISLALTKKKTPLPAKIMIILTIGYFLSPIDLIPDFIPVFGYLDDLVILPLMIAITLKLIPSDIITDCRLKANKTFEINRKYGYISAVVIVGLWILIIVFIMIKLV